MESRRDQTQKGQCLADHGASLFVAPLAAGDPFIERFFDGNEELIVIALAHLTSSVFIAGENEAVEDNVGSQMAELAICGKKPCETSQSFMMDTEHCPDLRISHGPIDQ